LPIHGDRLLVRRAVLRAAIAQAVVEADPVAAEGLLQPLDRIVQVLGAHPEIALDADVGEERGDATDGVDLGLSAGGLERLDPRR
jgi:hypothetical protein